MEFGRGFIAAIACMMLVNMAASYSVAYSPPSQSNISIALNSSSITLAPGSIGFVSFNMYLINGRPYPTVLDVVNYQGLSNKSIAVTPSPYTGTPPYSGEIKIYVGPNVQQGNYSILLNGLGGDGEVNNTVLALHVGSAQATAPTHANATGNETNSTTKPSQPTQPTTVLINGSTGISTIQPNNTSSQHSSGSQGGTSIQLSADVYYAVAAIIILIILAYLFLGRKPKKPQNVVPAPMPPPPAPAAQQPV
jgi:hypothetical protein